MINNGTHWGRRKTNKNTVLCTFPNVPIHLQVCLQKTFALRAVVLLVRHVLVERAKGKKIQMKVCERWGVREQRCVTVVGMAPCWNMAPNQLTGLQSFMWISRTSYSLQLQNTPTPMSSSKPPNFLALATTPTEEAVTHKYSIYGHLARTFFTLA